MFLLWFHCSGVLYKLHSNHSFCYCILLSLFISPADFTNKAEVATTVACNSPRSSSFDGNVICMLNIYLMHIIRLSTFWYYSNCLNWNSRFYHQVIIFIIQKRRVRWSFTFKWFYFFTDTDTLLILLILVLSFSNIISNSTNTNSSSNNYVSSFY